MRRLTREHRIYRFSRHDRPAIEVDPGEVILVETIDSFDGQFDLSRPQTIDVGTSPTDTTVDLERALPMTGPIYLRGAEPGDVVVAQILGVVATDNAFSAVFPGFTRALPGEEVPAGERWTVSVFELRRGKIQFTPDVQLPYNLMVGSLGVAPAGEPAETITPGAYGGNHDCTHLAQGAQLYLPVQTPGALISLGDVHATMGDGEGAGTAVECAGEVTVQFHLYKQQPLAGPVLETAGEWMVYGWGRQVDEAMAMAKNHTMRLLREHLGMGYSDTHNLLAAVGHLRANEVVNPLCSARVELPKAVIDPLLGFVLRETAASTEAMFQR